MMEVTSKARNLILHDSNTSQPITAKICTDAYADDM